MKKFKKNAWYEIISITESRELEKDTNSYQFDGWKIYYSSDVSIKEVDKNNFFLIPNFCLSVELDINFFIIKLYKNNGVWWLESDPCGLYSPYYSKHSKEINNNFYSILNDGQNVDLSHIPPYLEYFFIFGETPSSSIKKLMPTYKLNLTTLEAIKKKVWLPDKQAADDHKTEMINVIELLGGFLQKASQHHNIHIGFTGGYDSAVILAVLREFNIPFTPFLFVGDLNSKIDLFNASKIGKK